MIVFIKLTNLKECAQDILDYILFQSWRLMISNPERLSLSLANKAVCPEAVLCMFAELTFVNL